MARRSAWRSPRRLAVLALAVCVVGGGLGTYFAVRPSAAAAAPTDRLVTVTTSTLRSSVSSTGTVEPVDDATLDFAVSGEVASVAVTAGQQVKKGQTLATLDATALRDALAEAKANLAAAEATLSAAESATGTASSTAGAAALAADKAAVVSAQDQVASATQSLADATLSAPFAGTVASVDLVAGQEVGGSGVSSSSTTGAGGGSTGTGTGTGTGAGAAATGGGASTSGAGATSATSSSAGITLVGTTSWEVQASLDETEIGSVVVGDQATMTLSGGTTPFYGLVASVGVIPTVTSGVASYPVTIDVTGDPSGLEVGASATVDVVTRVLANVLVVPAAALHTAGTTTTVTVEEHGRQVSVPVHVGMEGAGEVQVTSGLRAGEEVVEAIPKAFRSLTTKLGTGAAGFARGAGGFGGGFGGGGFGGGGFGGGGFGGGAG